MYRQDLLDTAVEAVNYAWRREHWESIPHIFAGLATAMLQTSTAARVLQSTDEPQMQAGDVYAVSPTRIEVTTEDKVVPKLKIVCRPSLPLAKAPTPQQIMNICASMQVAADRLLYNLVNQSSPALTASEVKGWILSAMKNSAPHRTALVGCSVYHAFAHDIAHNVLRDAPEPEYRILPDDMLLVKAETADAPGYYTASPVRVSNIGHEEIGPINVVRNDPEFAEDDSRRNRLEFRLLTELAITLHNPEAFFLVSGAPRG